MKRLLLLTAALAGQTGLAAEKEKLVVLEITVADSTAKDGNSALTRLVQPIQEQILTELAENSRLAPIGKSDITTLLGLERQKQLLGCSEDSTSCLAEVSGALGAPWVLATTLSRVGETTRLDLKLLRAQEGQVAARLGSTLPSEKELPATLSRMLHELLLQAGLERSAPTPVAAWLLVALGGAAVVTGGIVLGLQASQSSSYPREVVDLSAAEAVNRRAGIYTERTASGVLLGVGAAMLAGGLAWALWPASSTSVAVAAWGDGGYAALRGAW